MSTSVTSGGGGGSVMAEVTDAILSKRLPGGRVLSTAGCVGVTTFIKTELIANGIGRACVPRIGGDRNGLRNGQKVDHEIQKWVENGMTSALKHAGSRHVAAGLRRLGIRPIKAQVRVTDPSRKLTTLIDLVGVGPNNTLWVVEIKATTLTTANHNKSYSQACRRTPMLRNAMVHSEQSAHFLQAAFGALALRRNYEVDPSVQVRACVLVATTDSCRTYVCPTKFLRERLFDRRQAVPLRKAETSSTLRRNTASGIKNPGVARSDALPTAPWPKKGSLEEKRIDAALSALQLVRVPGKRRSLWPVTRRGSGKTPVGMVALTPIAVGKMSKAQRGAVVGLLTRGARRLLAAHPRLIAAARLAIPACSPSAGNLVPCPGPLTRGK